MHVEDRLNARNTKLVIEETGQLRMCTCIPQKLRQQDHKA